MKIDCIYFTYLVTQLATDERRVYDIECNMKPTHTPQPHTQVDDIYSNKITDHDNSQNYPNDRERQNLTNLFMVFKIYKMEESSRTDSNM